MYDWRSVLDEVTASDSRLAATLARLTDAGQRAPSLLPGWSRGHVTAHIARNADSCWRLLEWARTGIEHAQYRDQEGREAEIEAGSGGSAKVLGEAVRAAAARLRDQALTLPAASWEAPVRALGGWPHPAWYTLYRRWREVEMHHVDLGTGYVPSPAYTRWELTESFGALARLGGSTVSLVEVTDLELTFGFRPGGPILTGPGTAVLGWLTGRTDDFAETTAPSWPLPSTTDWSTP
ncbi:MAG: maleylpyruvate isomerase family mycothiol-dependent enzyme [Streptosporangiaceae bacterium]